LEKGNHLTWRPGTRRRGRSPDLPAFRGERLAVRAGSLHQLRRRIDTARAAHGLSRQSESRDAEREGEPNLQGWPIASSTNGGALDNDASGPPRAALSVHARAAGECL